MYMSELALRAYKELYPDKRHVPKLKLRYSAKFSDFNGNVSMTKQFGVYTELLFSLSRKFQDTSEDIQMGIIQHLINRVHKTKIKTMEQDLYNNFIKHLTRYAERKESDPLLIELFNELNEEYFFGLMDQPNLVFGQASTTTLGHYNFSKDLVTASTVLKADRELLKFVVYHELLHKKHKFKTSESGRSQYHTTAFRKDEKAYAVKDIESQLSKFLAKKKLKNYFKWF